MHYSGIQCCNVYHTINIFSKDYLSCVNTLIGCKFDADVDDI